MEIHCAYDKLIDLDLLQPNPKNPNKHPEKQIKLLAKIMTHQGVRAPITVSKRSGFIIRGHGRLEAAKIAGIQQYPVDYQDYKDEASEYADMVADNKIAELANHDDVMMVDELKELPEFDYDLLGIPDFELPQPAPAVDEESVPDVQEDPGTKLGDIWELGEHRLMCGDATKDVDALLDGAKIDMVYTDPPYGMNLDTDYSEITGSKKAMSRLKGKSYAKVAGDDSEFDPSFIMSYFKNAKEIFLWGADYYAQSLPARSGSWVVWDKCTTKEGVVSSGAENMIGSTFELCWSRSKHKREIARLFHRGFTSVDSSARVHPTQKPIQLHEWFFNKWGKNTKTVADLYGGSGSTLIACEKTNRKCYMMELEPKYVRVIIDRWEKFTGKKAKLLNDH